MPKPANGFLAEDGTFFENEPECMRYENMKFLESLCDTHELNFENLMAVLNAWHLQIKGYYHADEACQNRQTKTDHTLDFTPKFNNDDLDDIAPFLRAEDDIPHTPSGDKNAPGFLEQQIRRNK
jgi:hypothetical protein